MAPCSQRLQEEPLTGSHAQDLDPDVTQEADSLFHTLVHEAINVPGDHGIPHKDVPISSSEADLKRLREGRTFFHRNYWACAWTIVFSELVQYPIQRITAFVVRNENYNGPNFGYLRGVVTFMHIRRWFDVGEGIENKMAASAQDALQVRKVHEAALNRMRDLPPSTPNKPARDRLHVLEAVRQDLKHVPTPDFLPTIMTQSPSVPISQFDMVLVLGVFYFLMDVSPERVGLYTNKGYESYIYYVGIIGRYLGIEDRFNIALHPNPAVRKAVSRRFWDQIITPCFKEFKKPEFENLCYFSEHGFLIDPVEVTMFMMIKDVLGVSPADNTWAHVNCIYRFLYRSLRSTFYLVRFRPLLWLGNIALRLWYMSGVVATRGRRNDNLNDPMSNSSQAGTEEATPRSRCPI